MRRPPSELEPRTTKKNSTTPDLRGALGEELRRARTRAGLTLQELARRSGGRYRASSLGGYERGERAISVIRFCELASLLGVPAEDLLSRALGRFAPDGRQEVVIDLSDLPDSSAGRHAAAFAHRVKADRGDFLSSVVTLRSGDLQVMAAESGLDVRTLLASLGSAVRRVGPG